MLAGTDRLDKELMIGQMQGMFGVSSFVHTVRWRLRQNWKRLTSRWGGGGMECREISASGFS